MERLVRCTYFLKKIIFTNLILIIFSKQYKQVEESIGEEGEGIQLTLSSILIMPLQRLPRFIHILKTTFDPFFF